MAVALRCIPAPLAGDAVRCRAKLQEIIDNKHFENNAFNHT